MITRVVQRCSNPLRARLAWCGSPRALVTKSEFYGNVEAGDAEKHAVPPKAPSISQQEKHLGTLQREVRDQYAQGSFASALDVAQTCHKAAEDLYGSDHPVTASCLNNTALIHKSLGKYDEATVDLEKAAGRRRPHGLSIVPV